MPLNYDPDTGVPSFTYDDAIELELEEGVTPKPDPFTKVGAFAGDPVPKLKKPPVIEPEVEHLGAVALTTQDGNRIPKDTVKVRRPPDLPKTHKGITIDAYALPPEELNKQIEDGIKRITEPSKLDAHVATDAEIEEVERLANAQAIQHWPVFLRLIHRIRKAEGRA